MPDLPPRRQHPAWIFLSAIRQLRGLAIPLAVLLFSGGRRGEGYFLAVTAVLIVVGLVARALAWWQFRYEVSGGELQVRSGLLARRERFIPLERIQAVDVNEAPLQRLLGVVGVRIETAAGGTAASDVSLEAVSRAEADLLRARLVAGRVEATAAATPDEGSTAPQSGAAARAGEGEPIRRLSTRDLLLAGATSGRIAPALAVLGFAVQLGDDLIPEEYWERIAMSAPGFSLVGVLTFVGVVAFLAWLLAIVSTALTFAGFELRRDGDRLLVAYGLLERRRRSVPLARIQAVAIGEGLLRQPLGLAAVRFESAGYGRDTAESGVLFPLLRRSEVPAFLAAATPAFAASIDPAGLAPPPRRAWGRYVLGPIWPLLILTALAVAVAGPVPWLRWWWGLAPLVPAPVAALHGWLRFRDTGWAIDERGRLVARSGGVERLTSILPRRRVQHRSVEQNPLQRRAALASFGAAVASGGAGGRVRLDHLDVDAAFALLDRLGAATREPASVTAAPPQPEAAAPPITRVG